MESSQETPTPSASPISLFWKLDQTLQMLLAVELGYLCLVIVGSAVSAILALLDVPAASSWLFDGTLILFIGIPLVFAYLGNLACGLLGLILHIKGKVTGYPGTGHLLNWVFIISTAWLFLFFLLILAPSLTGLSFD
jgi:hypothetical protein